MTLYIGEAKKYDLLEKVGQGRTGEVYKAARISISGKKRDIVAIKFLHNENEVQELISEFNIAQKIVSTRVAKYYALEKIADRNAIVMEYVEGKSLQSFAYHDMPKRQFYYI